VPEYARQLNSLLHHNQHSLELVFTNCMDYIAVCAEKLLSSANFSLLLKIFDQLNAANMVFYQKNSCSFTV